jgi:hypothetical protein
MLRNLGKPGFISSFVVVVEVRVHIASLLAFSTATTSFRSAASLITCPVDVAAKGVVEVEEVAAAGER